jgi:predicted dinucleotide-binding enzyme
MKIGIFGTGNVAQTIGSKLVALGHEVKLGSRAAQHEGAGKWVQATGNGATQGTFAEAAAFGEVLWNCTAGTGSLEALASAGDANLAGKVLIDVANPLDFSKGMPPTLAVSNNDSLGEQIQRAFPELRVVKALNTMSCSVMVAPSCLNGEHDVLIAGNDAAAKTQVTEILRGWFGWQSVIDLGDITASRGTEGYLLLWLRLWGAGKTPDFNIKIVR